MISSFAPNAPILLQCLTHKHVRKFIKDEKNDYKDEDYRKTELSEKRTEIGLQIT